MVIAVRSERRGNRQSAETNLPENPSQITNAQESLFGRGDGHVENSAF